MRSKPPERRMPDARALTSAALSASLLLPLSASARTDGPVNAQPLVSDPKQFSVPVVPDPAVKRREAEQQNEQQLYSALYQLTEEGWTGTPLSIDTINDALAQNAAADPDTIQLVREFGGIECARKTFTRGHRQIIVKLYRFGRSDGAFGAYLLLRRGSTNLIQRGDASSEDDQSISFWKDKFFVSVLSSDESDDEAKEIVTSFANKLAKTLTVSGAEPALIGRIPHLERVKGSEKVVMGPISLRRAFPAPNASIFSTGRILDGAVSDFQLTEPPERLKLMLLRYESAEVANAIYAKYVDQMDDIHRALTTDSQLPCSNVFKTNKTFAFSQLRTNEILIITGARRRQSLDFLAQEIY